MISIRVAVSLLLTAGISSCAAVRSEPIAAGEVGQVIGPPVRANHTPMDPVFACYRAALPKRSPSPVVGVGEVRDYTGKFSNVEGNAVTQGGALMVTSALGKLGDRVRVAERFDPSVAERELVFMDKRQLGDGATHRLPGQAGAPVKWLPYFGGSVIGSDYFIVGGITEVNYNIHSGGAEVAVNGMGPKARVFTQSVAVDLRIVDTRSLLVRKTISLTKQYVGYETGLGTFRFFGSDFFDINLGTKAQEPLQLGIRTTLEEATIRLTAAVLKIDPEPCLNTMDHEPDAGERANPATFRSASLP